MLSAVMPCREMNSLKELCVCVDVLSVQEAWELMFDSVDTLSACVRIATGIISTIKINPERMRSGLSADMLATDLAEYLVRKGGLILFLDNCVLKVLLLVTEGCQAHPGASA